MTTITYNHRRREQQMTRDALRRLERRGLRPETTPRIAEIARDSEERLYQDAVRECELRRASTRRIGMPEGS